MTISEIFYSIQCEGISTGIPSVFIRLTGCNLRCGLNKNHERLPLEEASWFCDSETVWRSGKSYTNEEVYKLIDNLGPLIWQGIRGHHIRIIWTGGEPTMPKHQRDILSFLDWLLLTYKIVPYNELETNGTFLLNQGFGDVISQINCSPKLANSGMTPEQRIRPEVIKQIQKHSNHQWKIVISSRDDYLEFVRDFVEPFNLAHKRIVLMPACDNREDLAEATKMTFEVAKEFQVRAITRSHILAYDRVTGV